MTRAAFVMLSVALAGCASGAGGTGEAPAAPVAWTQAAVAPPTAADAWWEAARAGDPVFADLVGEAGAVAADVEAAEARRAQASALLRAARARLFPTLDASAGASSIDDGVAFTPARNADLGLQAGYAVNLAGAEQLRRRSAAAGLAAQEATLAAARVEARRAAALLYVSFRTAQQRRAAAERSLAAAQDSLSLADTRSRAGLDTALAVAQARTARDAAQAEIPSLIQAEQAARLGLEALLARSPGTLAALLAEPAPPPRLDARVWLQSPAAVIAARPDLRAAEARLLAAGLDARAARADLWPSLSLSAALGVSDPSDAARFGTSSVAAGLLAPIFNAGRLDALADAADAAAQAEAALYAGAVRDALAAVETGLSRTAHAEAALAARRDAAASAREQAEIARARYTSGLTSFLDVLTADQALAAAETQLAFAEGEAAEAGVALAADLGLGGEADVR